MLAVRRQLDYRVIMPEIQGDEQQLTGDIATVRPIPRIVTLDGQSFRSPNGLTISVEAGLAAWDDDEPVERHLRGVDAHVGSAGVVGEGDGTAQP
jgi:hypothetical protein